MHLHQDTQRARKQNRIMQIDDGLNSNDRPALATFLSRKDVARRFGVSLSTVTRWARTGLIRAVRTPGGHYRYPAAELMRVLPSPAAAVAASPEQGGSDERHPRPQ
jgi:excisionase family DNA binding protein